jgi:beta-N-acetylhexosaminidase
LKTYAWIFILSAALLTQNSCEKKTPPGGTETAEYAVFAAAAEIAARDAERERRLQKARQIAALLTDEHLAAQVIMTGIDAKGPLSRGERERLRRVPAGAVMLFRKNLDTGVEAIKSMTRELRDEIRGAYGEADGGAWAEPFIAVDHEGGDVQRFTNGVAALPAPLSYRELALREGRSAALLAVETDAARSANEIAALGITMNLAPVAETLTEENAGFLGSRSYGPDADFTVEAAAAFMRGMKAANIACILKHFPGNSQIDPHTGTPVFSGGPAELRTAVEPFAALIGTAEPSAVMVSHIVIPAWDAGRNASLSETVMREKLRGELGFKGIILADDFSMGAVSGGASAEDAAVEAIRAGADMVMAWPRNLTPLHNAILAALAGGVLQRGRLEDAAARIISEKLRFTAH